MTGQPRRGKSGGESDSRTQRQQPNTTAAGIRQRKQPSCGGVLKSDRGPTEKNCAETGKNPSTASFAWRFMKHFRLTEHILRTIRRQKAYRMAPNWIACTIPSTNFLKKVCGQRRSTGGSATRSCGATWRRRNERRG